MDVQHEFRKRFLARKGFYAPEAKTSIIRNNYDKHINNLQSKNKNKVSRKPKRVGDKPKGTKEQKLKGNSARVLAAYRRNLADRMLS